MIIGVVRHGETNYNLKHLIQGISDIKLNDTGRRQCELTKPNVRKTKYDLCFSSPLSRAFETAVILVGEDTTIFKDDRLLERTYGSFEGKHDSIYDAKKFMDYNLNSSDEGVEPLKDVFKRTEEFLEYIKKDFKGKNVLIVTHSAIAKALYHIINSSDLENDYLDIEIENAQYNKYEI